MSEGKRVVAGEAILSGLATIEHSRNQMFEALVREHSRLVYRIAYAVLRGHPDAEDATQKTFIRVLRYSSKLATVADPKTWLARVAWRVAIDRSQRRGRTREVALEDPERPIPEAASSAASADETMHGTELSAALERMISARHYSSATFAASLNISTNIWRVSFPVCVF